MERGVIYSPKLLPSLRISGATTVLPIYAFKSWTGPTLPGLELSTCGGMNLATKVAQYVRYTAVFQHRQFPLTDCSEDSFILRCHVSGVTIYK